MTEANVEPFQSLRIAIDARLNAYRVGGIPQYTAQLVAALAMLNPDDHFVLLEHRKATRPTVEAPNVKRWRLWTPPHNRWEQWTLPMELLRVRTQALHCPDFIPPFRRGIPAVITVHDLAFLHYPEILDDDAKRYYGQIRQAVRSADAIIAVSEATRRDLQELLDVPAERVAVVAEAAAPIFAPLELEAGAERQINGVRLTAGTFALFVGTIEPRKNLETLLRAFAHARATAGGSGMRLAIAGPRGWLDATIFELISDLRLGDQLLLLGGVTQEELVWLYNACHCYLQPELHSGFGLPVLEAMQCGAPVAVADTAALPELVGDAGLRLPPKEAEAWSDALVRLWNDDALRRELRRRGFERAATYSWERAARETRAVYQQVAG